MLGATFTFIILHFAFSSLQLLPSSCRTGIYFFRSKSSQKTFRSAFLLLIGKYIGFGCFINVKKVERSCWEKRHLKLQFGLICYNRRCTPSLKQIMNISSLILLNLFTIGCTRIEGKIVMYLHSKTKKASPHLWEGFPLSCVDQFMNSDRRVPEHDPSWSH